MAESENRVETEEIGSVLKAAREASGASLDDVSALLKIRSVHLQALEEDDFDNVPGSVYAIGFIRTYANHLGLNGAELIGRYKAATQPPHQQEDGYNPQTEAEPVSGALKIAIAVIGVFAFYILWLIAGGAGGSDPETRTVSAPVPQQEKIETPKAETPKPTPRPTSEETQNTESPSSAPSTSPSSSPSKPPANVLSANDTAAVLPEADPVSSQPAVEVQAIGSLPQAAGDTDISDSATAALAVDEAAENAEIEIRALRRTWMRIEDPDGKVLFSSIIREGEGFTFGAADSYTLATRDAGALEYRVNEQQVGAVGRRGQILTARKIDRTFVLSLAAQ